MDIRSYQLIETTVLFNNDLYIRRVQCEYESKISEWGALEAIVVQQDREITAANMAR